MSAARPPRRSFAPPMIRSARPLRAAVPERVAERSGGFQPPTGGAAVAPRTRSRRPLSAAGSRRYDASRFVLTAAVLLTFAAVAPADEVIRRGGAPPVRGAITAATRGELTIRPTAGGAAETVPAAEVDEISWDGEPPNLPALRGRESRGLLEDALAGYREAAGTMNQIGPLARGDIEFLIARALAKLALNDPARRDEAVAALDKFVTGNPDHHRTDPALRLSAEVRLAAGDLDGAAAALEKLGASPSPEYQTAAAVAAGDVALARGEADAALAAFEAAAANADGRAALEARLGRAAALGRLNRHAEALEALNAVLAEADPGDAELRARAHLRRGDSLQATGETKAAIVEYLRVDVLYPGASGAHAESLYNLARLWTTAGFPARAAESAASLKAAYPNSAWAARLSGG